MNELTHDERRRWAYFLYTEKDLGIKDLALEVNTDEATVRAWMQEGAWAQVKRSRLTTKAAQLDYLYAVLENLRCKDSKDATPKDADQVLKYTAAIRNLEDATTVSEIIEVSELFIRWLRRRDLQLTKIVVKQLDSFIKEMLTE